MTLPLEPTREEILEDIAEGILAARRGDPMPSWDEFWAEVDQEEDEETAS